VHEALEAFPIREAALNRAVALNALAISLPHKDPADRFLAATTLVYDLILVTVDARLMEADWLPTLPPR
jgi:PIN domain nuclease of toxin-antitoxin system